MKNPNPKLLVISGLSLVTFAIIWLSVQISIPGFGFDFEADDIAYFIDLSFLGGYFMLFIGIYLVSRVFFSSASLTDRSFKKRKYKAETHVNTSDKAMEIISIPKSRLGVAGLFLTLTIWTFIEFGPNFGRAAVKGQWFVLGGPSLFYAMGVIPGIIGLILLIYSLGAKVNIRIERTDTEILWQEHRIFSHAHTSIPIEDIDLIQLNNTHIGAKNLWIPLLSLYIVYTMIDGVSLYANPNTMGYAIETGILYIISSVIGIIGLIILMIKRQNFLQIISKEALYEFQFFFSEPKSSTTQRNALIKLLELQHLDFPDNNSSHKWSIFALIQKNFQLVLGIIFIFLAIVSRSLYFGLSEYLRWFLIVYGIILIFSQNSSKKFTSLAEIYSDTKEEKKLSLLKQSKSRFNFQSFQNFDDKQKEIHFNHLEFYDWVAIPLIFLFGGWEIQKMGMLPRSAINYGVIFGINVGTVLVVMGLLLIMIFRPLTVIKITQNEFTWITPIANENDEKSSFKILFSKNNIGLYRILLAIISFSAGILIGVLA